MAFTIGEANDLNVLLEYALNLSGPMGVPSSDKAMEAAARLADKATKTLMAGLDGDRVRAAWPEDDDEDEVEEYEPEVAARLAHLMAGGQ